MKKTKLKFLSAETPDDLTIIYKEDENNIHELKTKSDKFLKYLRFYNPQSNEIKHTKLVYIQEEIKFDIFADFIASIKTKEIEISEENYSQYYYLSDKYEFYELKEKVTGFINSRPDIISIINQLSKKEDQDQSTPIDFQKEELIAKNLDISIKSGLLSKLPLEMIIRITNSPNKVLKDDHLLFNFIIDLINKKNTGKLSQKDQENIFLLPSCLNYCTMANDQIQMLFDVEHSNFDKFLNPSNSEERMKIFISNEEKYKKRFEQLELSLKNIEDAHKSEIKKLEKRIENSERKFEDEIAKRNQINDELQKRLEMVEKGHAYLNTKMELQEKTQNSINEESKKQKVRINAIEKVVSAIQKKQSSTMQPKRAKPICLVTYKNDAKNRFNGIITKLGNGDSKSVIEKKIIDITVSSVYENSSNWCQPKNVVDYNNSKNCFNSSNSPDSWLCIDFKENCVNPSHYSIQSNGYIRQDEHPCNWNIEGSNCNKVWDVLDSRHNESSLCSTDAENTFKIQNSSDTFYRYIRIRQTGKNAKNTDELYFSSIEFFGSYTKI